MEKAFRTSIWPISSASLTRTPGILIFFHDFRVNVLQNRISDHDFRVNCCQNRQFVFTKNFANKYFFSGTVDFKEYMAYAKEHDEQELFKKNSEKKNFYFQVTAIFHRFPAHSATKSKNVHQIRNCFFTRNSKNIKSFQVKSMPRVFWTNRFHAGSTIFAHLCANTTFKR